VFLREDPSKGAGHDDPELTLGSQWRRNRAQGGAGGMCRGLSSQRGESGRGLEGKQLTVEPVAEPHTTSYGKVPSLL